MVAQFNRHDIKWLSPSSMWNALSDSSGGDLSGNDFSGDESSAESRRRCFNRPAILRFKNDNFMDELLALMNDYPDKLAEWQVRPETWREPMTSPPTAAKLSLAEPFSQLASRQTRESRAQRNISSALPVGENTPQVDCEIKQDPDKPLKLYQPAQQRFYLVAASLVCRRTGLPDRFIDPGKQQQSGFVLRRLIPREAGSIKTPDTCDLKTCDEYALVQTVDGTQWRNISQHPVFNTDQAVPDEERLPMFSIGFSDLDNRKRRLLSGFIPVGKREAYLGAELFDEDRVDNETPGGEVAQTNLRDAIKQRFELEVAGPWKAMLEQAEIERQRVSELNTTPSSFSGESAPDPDMDLANNIKTSREQIQTISWYVLLDMLNFFEKYLNDIYRVIAGEKNSLNLQTDEERKLYEALVSIKAGNDLKLALNNVDNNHSYSQISNDLLAALKMIDSDKNIEINLEKVDVAYDQAISTSNLWPAFLFPLADPELGITVPLPDLEIDNKIVTEPEKSHAKIDALSELVKQALPDDLKMTAPEVVSFKSAELDNGDGWFVIRCIYEQPNCGPFFPAVLSQPTEPFKMASFFDPDAPGRPIRIPMPLDISPAGLRKFNKNTSLMISDMLCGKIKSIKKITFGDLVLSVLPWPFHKNLPNVSKTGPCKSGSNTFGMFCSLSIPIVTLCALILLIIMVSLFDLFFRWIPLLFTCFPLPGLKGKKS
ncbi:MAG TPA: hypothetical protein ENJ08_16675 [Gammaproteobacteria bacterium]|nr:hypothetical protein [Gammaproteobacteria bacterium]